MKHSKLRKLTPDQVRELRSSRVYHEPGGGGRKEGSVRWLALKYGISDCLVVRICKGHAYKEVL
jgi:hypothetical protein